MKIILVVASSMMILQTACGFWGTNTGNPGPDRLQTNLPIQGSQAQLLTFRVCDKITRCFSSAKLDPRAGQYSTLQDLGTAELAGKILVNTVAARFCEEAIKGLDCASKPVTDSYHPEVSNAFIESYHLFEVTRECQKIYEE